MNEIVVIAMRAVALGVFCVLVASCAPTARDVTMSEPENETLFCAANFPASALSGPTGAEEAEDPPAQALREFLAHQRADPPRAMTGYRVLARDEEAVTFGAGEPPDLDVVRVGFNVPDEEPSTWAVDASGTCWPEVVRGGYEVAHWYPLAPPEGRSLRLRYRVCSSPEDRFERAEFTETEDAVVVTVLLRPDEKDLKIHAVQPDGQDFMAGCQAAYQGPDRYDRVVQLPSPLDGRQLLDGSVYPPCVPIDADEEAADGASPIETCKRASQG